MGEIDYKNAAGNLEAVRGANGAFIIRNDELMVTATPTNATKTVNTTAAEIFAGSSSRIAGSNYLRLDNTLGTTTIYYLVNQTPTSGSAGTGIPILVGDYREIYTTLPVYCIADDVNSYVRVEERVI